MASHQCNCETKQLTYRCKTDSVAQVRVHANENDGHFRRMVLRRPQCKSFLLFLLNTERRVYLHFGYLFDSLLSGNLWTVCCLYCFKGGWSYDAFIRALRHDPKECAYAKIWVQQAITSFHWLTETQTSKTLAKSNNAVQRVSKCPQIFADVSLCLRQRSQTVYTDRTVCHLQRFSLGIKNRKVTYRSSPDLSTKIATPSLKVRTFTVVLARGERQLTCRVPETDGIRSAIDVKLWGTL